MSDFINVAGKQIEKLSLRADRAVQLVEYLESNPPYASLIELQALGDYDVVVIEADVERPQKTVHDIASKERLGIYFDSRADVLPSILALREDFPLVPHVNQTPVEKPRSLCLYEESWPQVRLSWTAARFIRRIRTWLADTSVGELHRDDQVLEPLIMPTQWTLVLPADLDASVLGAKAEVKNVQFWGEKTVVVRPPEETSENPTHLLFAIAAPAKCHGLIRRTPQNLKQLHELLSEFGVNLAEDFKDRILAWKTEVENNPVFKLKPIILIALPKCREDGSPIESTEFHAFFSEKTIEDMAVALNILSKEGTAVAGVIIGQEPSIEALSALNLLPMQVLSGLSRHRAAEFNGVPLFEEPIFAIGFGAIGSQVFNNLIRSGFGKWTVFDFDTFAPHNAARHLCLANATGKTKAALAHDTNNGFEWEVVSRTVSKDALELSANDLKDAAVVFDFSASVPVSRHLAHIEGLNVRCISIFITPGGGGLVILVEDRERKMRLDWLEMLHYRQALHNSVGIGTMVAASKSRYGNGCRDVSAVLSQDDVALWASTASRALKKNAIGDSASVQLWKRDIDTGAVVSDAVIPPACFRLQMHGWTVVYDQWLQEKLSSYRNPKLPNETGGILIGHFDVQNLTCYLVDALPSPRDSIEWPEAYYRGCEGLHAAVLEIENKTLGQLTYVGEWHSHPNGCTTYPSADDMTAYGWLVYHMNFDSYPAIMLIVGHGDSLGIVAAEPLK